MKEDLVSIVVPVYKVEDLLPRCVDSIIKQDHKNLEIILVNDGSPDNCGELIDSYAENYPDIIVPLHQENQGAGAARNNGLAIATGEWVCFIDSDDYIEPDYVSTMLEIADKKEADIVVSNLYLEAPNGLRVRYPMVFLRPVVEGKCAAKNSLDLITVPNFAWNKLYRLSLLREIGFAFPSMYFEDVAVASRTLFSAAKVAFTMKPLYHYCQRADSQVGSFNEKKLDEALDAIDLVGKFLSDEGKLTEWKWAWRRLLLTCRAQFTAQIMLQFKGKDLGERTEYIKKLRSRLREISDKYKVKD